MLVSLHRAAQEAKSQKGPEELMAPWVQTAVQAWGPELKSPEAISTGPGLLQEDRRQEQMEDHQKLTEDKKEALFQTRRKQRTDSQGCRLTMWCAVEHPLEES